MTPSGWVTGENLCRRGDREDITFWAAADTVEILVGISENNDDHKYIKTLFPPKLSRKRCYFTSHLFCVLNMHYFVKVDQQEHKRTSSVSSLFQLDE